MKRDGFWASTKGNVMLTFGLAAVPLMLIAGAGIDYSQALLTKTNLQAAADAASLAAARATGNNSARERHGADMFNQQVQQDPRLASLNPAVSVKVAKDIATVTAQAVQPNAFLDLTGLAVNPVGAKSQATTVKRRPVCMLALDETASPAIALVGAAQINAPDCVVQSNSTANDSITVQGAAKGEAEEFCTVGGYTARGNFTPPPVGNCPKVDNPLASLPPPSPGDCWMTLRAGDPIPATIDLAEGRNLCVEGTMLSRSGGTLRLRGGTLHLIGNNSELDIGGNAVVDITAPKTGPYAGIAIAQHGVTVRGTSTIGGTGDINFVGTIYMPNQHINMRGNGVLSGGSPAWSIVAATFELRGTPDIVINSDFAAAGYGEAIVRTMGGVVLVR